MRQQLGQRGMDSDVGQRGPVFRKWYDSVLTQQVGAAKIAPRASELHLLVSVLDEFMQGRMIEVGDMLASRLRYLAYGLTSDHWNLAEHFLCYARAQGTLVSADMEDEAIRLRRVEARRAADLAGSKRSTKSPAR